MARKYEFVSSRVNIEIDFYSCCCVCRYVGARQYKRCTLTPQLVHRDLNIDPEAEVLRQHGFSGGSDSPPQRIPHISFVEIAV
jgi:hypothetical protein